MTEVDFHDGLDPSLVDELLAFYKREWWTDDRERDGVQRMLTGSDLVISATSGEDLVGFVRAITDGVYRAAIFDLIVDPAWRGRGLGVELIERAHAHPVLAGCRRVELICVEEMVPFYAKRGYELSLPEHLRMIWRRPDWGQ
jgi:GNAT superfamily N-acetyltransferase